MTFSSRRIAGKGKGAIIAEAVEDPNFDRKLDLITEGCRPISIYLNLKGFVHFRFCSLGQSAPLEKISFRQLFAVELLLPYMLYL